VTEIDPTYAWSMQARRERLAAVCLPLLPKLAEGGVQHTVLHSAHSVIACVQVLSGVGVVDGVDKLFDEMHSYLAGAPSLAGCCTAGA